MEENEGGHGDNAGDIKEVNKREKEERNEERNQSEEAR